MDYNIVLSLNNTICLLLATEMIILWSILSTHNRNTFLCQNEVLSVHTYVAIAMYMRELVQKIILTTKEFSTLKT